MNIEECLEKGLLAKAEADAPKAKSSLEVARHKLEIAKKEMEHEIFEGAIINAYTSMFHSARALLFADGYKERSHYALWVYANEKYSDKIEKKYLNELNSLRLTRHSLMYGLEEEETQGEGAKSAIESAEGFLLAVRGIIEGKKSGNKQS